MQKTPLKYPMLYGFPLIPYPCTSPQSPQLRCTHSHQNTDNQAKRPKSVKFQKLFCFAWCQTTLNSVHLILPNRKKCCQINLLHAQFFTSLTNPCPHRSPFSLCNATTSFFIIFVLSGPGTARKEQDFHLHKHTKRAPYTLRNASILVLNCSPASLVLNIRLH